MEKIDLVYLWVSDKDPVWLAKKNQYQPIEAKTNEDNCVGRWFDNEELKYSLRSVDKFAPWINHIFIVSDHQTPPWLNVDHPKITMVNHEEIIPQEYLPIFNPRVLEMRFAHIPNLSERFLYANDDMFFGRPVRPSDFYKRDGRPIMRVVFKRNQSKYYKDPQLFDSYCSYIRGLFRMRYLIFKRFGVRCNFIPHHNIDVYTKTELREAEELDPQLKATTFLRRFRADDDWCRSLVEYYSWVRHRAVRRFVTLSFMRNKTNYLLGRMCRMLHIPIVTSVLYNVGQKWHGIKHMSELAPMFFCINDGGGATDADRREVHDFFEQAFPEKSQFEK